MNTTLTPAKMIQPPRLPPCDAAPIKQKIPIEAHASAMTMRQKNEIHLLRKRID